MLALHIQSGTVPLSEAAVHGGLGGGEQGEPFQVTGMVLLGEAPPIPQTAMKVSIQTQFSRWGNGSSKQHQDIGLGVILMCMSMQAHTCMHTHTHVHTSSTWLQDQPTDRSHFPDLETEEMGGGQGSHLLFFVQSIGRRQLHLGLLCPIEDPRQWRWMDEGQGPGVKKESGDRAPSWQLAPASVEISLGKGLPGQFWGLE